MDYSKYETFFSQTRMNKYLVSAKGNTERAMAAYKANIQLSQTIYPLILIFEVALRNALDRILSIHFNDEKWLISQKDKFMLHPDLVYKNPRTKQWESDKFLFNRVNAAEIKIIQSRIPVSHSKLVAELGFSFGVKLLDNKPVRILKGATIKAFKNTPSLSATLIHEHLSGIREVRNRISHHEPICFNAAGELCPVRSQLTYNQVNTALYWIDKDLQDWSKKINFVLPVLKRFEKIVI